MSRGGNPKGKQGTALGVFGVGNVGAAVITFLAPFVMIAFGWPAVAQVWASELAVMTPDSKARGGGQCAHVQNLTGPYVCRPPHLKALSKINRTPARLAVKPRRGRRAGPATPVEVLAFMRKLQRKKAAGGPPRV
jgi:hypothetical protein